MCGIAVIVSGIRVELSNLIPDYTPPSHQSSQQVLFSIDDIKSALSRRGPDSIGSKSVSVTFKKLTFDEEAEDRDLVGCEDETVVQLQFIGATLQLRGIAPVVQPLEDSYGNVLVYNGEIYGGVHVGNDCNDSEILMQLLGQCNSCVSNDHGSGEDGIATVPQLLSRIKGPWALIYWQNSSKTLWFGRDAFGRRSLLVHWPSQQDSRLLLTSVSPLSFEYEISDSKDSEKLNYWEELPCSLYNISFGSSSTNKYPVGELKRHKWTDEYLDELVDWERNAIQPEAGKLCILPENGSAPSEASHRVLTSLKEAVKRRTVLNATNQSVSSSNGNGGHAPVAVLFSGGLDSMILSALLDQCLDPKYEIDLLNVSFDGQCAPDRISSRAGLEELKTIAPSRRWKLVEIDADLVKLTSELKHVVSLISPAKTYMDLNIGIALWLAAGGEGWIYGGSDDSQPVKYKSEARVLLTGTGADEQCAGYGRYKTKYRNGSWLALHEEMKLDMQRIWKRNLGRDDRCIADNGKEARFPFLDEDVIRTLLDIPLWELADLDQPSGVGDKKILREVARMLGLSGAAGLPKRAIQFGTRVARESNRINFGSNRAANQASAGSVEIYKASC